MSEMWNFQQRDEAPSSPMWKIVAVLAVGLLLGLGGVALWRWKQSQETRPVPVAQQVPEAKAPPAQTVPRLPMAEGDGLLRQLLPQLSNSKELAQWLSQGDILRRLVAAVNLVAEGNSPRSVVSFLNPPGRFQVTERNNQIYASPRSYARYDLVTRVLTSIDVSAAAKVYEQLKPYLDSAFAEIGRPGKSFDSVLREAIGKLTSTPVPETEPVLQPKGLAYAYTDPRLESLSAAQKHLLRM